MDYNKPPIKKFKNSPKTNMFSLNVPAKYSNSVYNIIRPFYICSRLYGYTPFSATITQPSSNKIYLTRLDRFIFIIHVVAYALCAVFNSDLEFNFNTSSSKLLTVGMKIQLTFGIYGCLVLLFVELFFRNHCWKIIESLNDFDIELKNVGKEINHLKYKTLIGYYFKVCISMSVIFFIYTFVIFAHYTDILPLSVFLGSYALLTGTFAVISTTYSFFILSVKVRYEALNNYLRDEGQLSNQIKVIDSNNKDGLVYKITQMAQLHDKLNDIIGLINRRYSIQVMLLVVAIDFTFSVLSLFSLYRACKISPVEKSEFLHATIQLIWTLHYNFLIITVIWSGSSIRSEGELTGVLVHRVINSCTDKYAIEKLSLFSQQLKHQAPIATCKLFVFDWTLFYSIVAATTTYLTILIQFDSSLVGNNNFNVTTNM